MHVDLLVRESTVSSEAHRVLGSRLGALVDAAQAHLLKSLHGLVAGHMQLHRAARELLEVRLLAALVHLDHQVRN